MSRGKPDSPARCLPAMLLTLLVLALLVGLVAWPWFERNKAYDENLGNNVWQLQRFLAVKARRPGVEAELAKIDQQVATDGHYLSSANSALAAAELQKTVKSNVESNKGKLISIQSLPETREGGAHRVGIRVRMSGDVDAVFTLLHELETQKPILLVDNLTVRSKVTRSRRNKRDRTKPTKQGYSLDVQFDIAGYLRGKAG